MNSILNIILCYHNKEEVKQYVNQLIKLKVTEQVKICIGINDETDPNYFNDIMEHTHIITCKNEDNLGYLNGALNAYRMAKQCQKENWRWVIISNTDIEYCDDAFFEKLLIHNSYNDDIWAIGPDIYCPYTQEHQNPRYKKRISRSKMRMYMAVYSNVVTAYLYCAANRAKKKFFRRKKVSIGCSDVYIIHGAYMILAPALVDFLAKEKYKGFMYHEEQYIAETVLKNRKRAVYDSSMKVIHNEHSATGKNSFYKKYKQMKQSYIANYKFYINDRQGKQK